jgi:hypothetical protein
MYAISATKSHTTAMDKIFCHGMEISARYESQVNHLRRLCTGRSVADLALLLRFNNVPVTYRNGMLNETEDEYLRRQYVYNRRVSF